MWYALSTTILRKQIHKLMSRRLNNVSMNKNNNHSKYTIIYEETLYHTFGTFCL